MSFVGIEFAFFLPALILAYWALPRRAAWQNGFLLAISYAFYASWSIRFVPLLLACTAVDYWAALSIERGRLRRAAGEAAGDAAAVQAGERLARFALGTSVAAGLGVLAWFKYVGFFADSLNTMLGTVGLDASVPVLRLLLPLGVSFFTLQKLGYVLDVYHGRIEPERSPLRFALFVAYFPQLTAGPISRAGSLLPQLARPRALAPALAASGAATFLLGYALKGWIADWAGPALVDPVFASPGEYSVLGHWMALVGYAIQVFCDFAGYSLLAIGTSRLLGIELPVNFDYPFLSRSLPEMWRRWHITLNQWLFDYIYNPLVTGGGRFRGRLDAGLMVVFLASGLWHGASLTFVLWGALHGAGMIVHRHWDTYYRGLCRKDRVWVKRRQAAWYGRTAWVLTQLFFLLTLVPFRAPGFGDMAGFARGLVTSAGSALPGIGSLPSLINLSGAFAFMVLYHLAATERGKATWRRFLALPAPVRGLAYGLGVVYLLLWVPVGSSTFIYRQF